MERLGMSLTGFIVKKKFYRKIQTGLFMVIDFWMISLRKLLNLAEITMLHLSTNGTSDIKLKSTIKVLQDGDGNEFQKATILSLFMMNVKKKVFRSRSFFLLSLRVVGIRTKTTKRMLRGIGNLSPQLLGR